MPNTCKFGKSSQEKFQPATTQLHDGCNKAGNHKATFQTASDYYIQVHTDSGGIIRSINRYGASFFRKTEKEILGQNLFELLSPMESVLNGAQKKIVRCFMSSPEKSEFAEFETRPGQEETKRVAWIRSITQMPGRRASNITYIGIPVATPMDGEKKCLSGTEFKNKGAFHKRPQNDVSVGKYCSLETYLENSDMWAWETGFDGNISYVTPSVEKILGYSPKEIIQLSIADLMTEKTKTEFEAFISTAKKEGDGQIRLNGEIRDKNGSVKQSDFVVAAYTDQRGDALGFRGVCRDLSTDVTYEEEIRIREKEYRYLFDNTQVAIFVIDEEGIIRNINQTGAGINGKTPEEMIGRKFTDFILTDVREKAYRAFLKNYRRAKLQNTNFVDAPPYVVRLETQEGIRYLHIVSKAIKVIENGEMAGLLHTGMDVTESMMLQEKLKKHQKKLRRIVAERNEKIEALQEDLLRNEKLTALGMLTSKVSHEIRNPLGTINSSLYIIKERLKEGDYGTLNAIERGFRAVSRCDGIIEEMMDFTRTKVLEKRAVNVTNWLEKLINDMVFPKEVTIEKKITKGLAAPIDVLRLHKCISNIIENSLEAMGGDKSGEITLSARKYDDNLEIRITDSGCGISRKEQKKAFDPLYSTKKNGIGMGLPVSKKVMDLHEGTIQLKSERGRGTTVILRLPTS
jgi:PAS domain S-box-containing protein